MVFFFFFFFSFFFFVCLRVVPFFAFAFQPQTGFRPHRLRCLEQADLVFCCSANTKKQKKRGLLQRTEKRQNRRQSATHRLQVTTQTLSRFPPAVCACLRLVLCPSVSGPLLISASFAAAKTSTPRKVSLSFTFESANSRGALATHCGPWPVAQQSQ